MNSLLTLTYREKFRLVIGILLLVTLLVIANIQPFLEGLSQVEFLKPKPRPTTLSPGIVMPNNYTGNLNDLPKDRFVSLDVLVLVYENVGDGSLNGSAMSDVEQAVKLARDYFWRNTRFQLNLNAQITEVYDSLPGNFVSDDGGLWPKSGELETDIISKRGIKPNQYDLIFAIYPSGKENAGSGMQLKRLGKTAYSFASYPQDANLIYHPDGPTITWPLTSHLWNSINTVVYKRDPVNPANFYDLYTTLINYSIQDPPKQYGQIFTTGDMDGDGIPDDDNFVPFCEMSLNLNRETADSDGDRYEDTLELRAGIFNEGDSLFPDRDSDGLKDGDDPFPLYDVRNFINRGDSAVDGFSSKIFWSNIKDFNVKSYLNYDDGYVYFKFEPNFSTDVRIYVDNLDNFALYSSGTGAVQGRVKRLTKENAIMLRVDFDNIDGEANTRATIFEPYVFVKINLK